MRNRSDWGIDTVLTYATSVMDLGLYEHHVADGKSTRSTDPRRAAGHAHRMSSMLPHRLGNPGPTPDTPPIRRHGSRRTEQIVAYDVAGTARLPRDRLEPRRRPVWSRGSPPTCSVSFEDPIARTSSSWMLIAGIWRHGFLMEGFTLGDPAESLAFRLWLTRVLAYTTNQAGKGSTLAMTYLESTILRYEAMAAGSS